MHYNSRRELILPMLPYAALCCHVPLQVFESRQYPDSAQRLAAGAAGGCVLSAHVSAVSHCAGNHAADAAVQVSPLCNPEWYGCGYKRNDSANISWSWRQQQTHAH